MCEEVILHKDDKPLDGQVVTRESGESAQEMFRISMS